jgi:predicted nucleic acid-binding protein
VIDWDDPAVLAGLPAEVPVSAITLAELAAGPHLAATRTEAAARSYGQVAAAVAAAGRSHPGRVADRLIAAVGHANGLDVYTRNPDDFAGLEDLVRIVGV